MPMQYQIKKKTTEILTKSQIVIMTVINNMKVRQAVVQHWPTNKLNVYNNITLDHPDIILLNKHEIRKNGKINIFGYKTEWKNISNQARDRVGLALKKNINYRIINNLSNNTVACKIQRNLGPVIIECLLY